MMQRKKGSLQENPASFIYRRRTVAFPRGRTTLASDSESVDSSLLEHPDELSSLSLHRLPPQSILTRLPLRVTPQHRQDPTLESDDNELGELTPEHRLDTSEPTDEAGLTRPSLYNDACSSFAVKSTIGSGERL
jgi:hypothetical protein